MFNISTLFFFLIDPAEIGKCLAQECILYAIKYGSQ